MSLSIGMALDVVLNDVVVAANIEVDTPVDFISKGLIGGAVVLKFIPPSDTLAVLAVSDFPLIHGALSGVEKPGV